MISTNIKRAALLSSTTHDTMMMAKPRRPLNPYQRFFREERLQLLDLKNDRSDPLSATHQAAETLHGVKRKRRHIKTHGAISFECMTKHVSAKWKNVDPSTKQEYKYDFERFTTQYKLEMEHYKQQLCSEGEKRRMHGSQQEEVAGSPKMQRNFEAASMKTNVAGSHCHTVISEELFKMMPARSYVPPIATPAMTSEENSVASGATDSGLDVHAKKKQKASDEVKVESYGSIFEEQPWLRQASQRNVFSCLSHTDHSSSTGWNVQGATKDYQQSHHGASLIQNGFSRGTQENNRVEPLLTPDNRFHHSGIVSLHDFKKPKVPEARPALIDYKMDLEPFSIEQMCQGATGLFKDTKDFGEMTAQEESCCIS
jgi:hypothetical protein